MEGYTQDPFDFPLESIGEVSDDLRYASDAQALREAIYYAALTQEGLTEEDVVYKFVEWRKGQKG